MLQTKTYKKKNFEKLGSLDLLYCENVWVKKYRFIFKNEFIPHKQTKKLLLFTWTGDEISWFTFTSNDTETFPGKVKLDGLIFQLLTVTTEFESLHTAAFVILP